jgi:hypothetical protein
VHFAARDADKRADTAAQSAAAVSSPRAPERAEIEESDLPPNHADSKPFIKVGRILAGQQ